MALPFANLFARNLHPVVTLRMRPRRTGLCQAILALVFGMFLTASIHSQEAISSARRTKSEEPHRNPVESPGDKGIRFPVTFTTEVLGNLSGGSSRTAIWESLLKAGIKIDFEKAAGIKGLSLSVSGLYPQGSGLTSEAVHDFNTLSNIDGYDSVRLYEAWLQQEWSGGKFSIRLGQILADAEFFASDYGALFMNSSFGAIPLVSKNLNAPIFPVAAPGIRVRAAPGKAFYAEVALFSGDVGEPSTTNKHNTRLKFRGRDGALVFAEIGYKLNPKEKEPALPTAPDEPPDASEPPPPPKPPTLAGTYKLGGFYDSGEFADSSGGGASHQGNYSIYFIADQELWHPSGNGERALSFFLRIGAAPNDRNTVAMYADAGLNLKGIFPTREKDTLGLGFSYADLSPGLVDNLNLRISTHHEGVLELTYQAAFGDHVSVQPDLQFIFNPGATKPAATAVVSGVRLNLKF